MLHLLGYGWFLTLCVVGSCDHRGHAGAHKGLCSSLARALEG